MDCCNGSSRAARDFDEAWLNKYLPDGFWASRHWGRFDLLRTLPKGKTVGGTHGARDPLASSPAREVR